MADSTIGIDSIVIVVIGARAGAVRQYPVGSSWAGRAGSRRSNGASGTLIIAGDTAGCSRVVVLGGGAGAQPR